MYPSLVFEEWKVEEGAGLLQHDGQETPLGAEWATSPG